MTNTEEFIKQLNDAEEVLAALDQVAGDVFPIARACRKAYLAIEALRDSEAEDWNSDPEETQKIYRCSEAQQHYHTDANGPCEVWSTDQVCSLHVQLAEEQMASAAQCSVDRADYFRRKNRGEDI